MTNMMKLTRAALFGVAVVAVSAAAIAQHDRLDDAAIDAALRRHGVELGPSGAGVIAAWNELAHDIAFAEDQFLTFKGQRALAMMHLAMHDALNSIVSVYQPYAYSSPRPVAAHPVAAAAQAEHDVLADQYPNQRPALDAELSRWLDPLSKGMRRNRGIDVGRAAAAAILAVRSDDGWDLPGTYEFRTGPGEYQTTPPWNGFAAQPGFRFARQFAVGKLSRFRPATPTPLASADYARSFQEVKDYGAVDSIRRTEDQTAYAIWWMEFAEGSVNRLTRQLATGRRLHLWNTARTFAHIGMALFDTYVAVWDSKYEYNYWRPY